MEHVNDDAEILARDLINTSVEDMQSTLRCAEVNKSALFNSAILQIAYDRVVKRNEKTKARILKSFIQKAIKFERTRSYAFEKMKYSQLLDMLKSGASPVTQVKIVEEIQRRENIFRETVNNALSEIEEDERLQYPTATVVENAPLALVQCGLENQIRALKYVLMALDKKDGES
jgi:S-adenosylmethionine:diacylglycerol 3-amino-3-carboxypropyl transferase